MGLLRLPDLMLVLYQMENVNTESQTKEITKVQEGVRAGDEPMG
jgi:hypothetical protein